MLHYKDVLFEYKDKKKRQNLAIDFGKVSHLNRSQLFFNKMACKRCKTGSNISF